MALKVDQDGAILVTAPPGPIIPPNGLKRGASVEGARFGRRAAKRPVVWAVADAG